MHLPYFFMGLGLRDALTVALCVGNVTGSDERRLGCLQVETPEERAARRAQKKAKKESKGG